MLDTYHVSCVEDGAPVFTPVEEELVTVGEAGLEAAKVYGKVLDTGGCVEARATLDAEGVAGGAAALKEEDWVGRDLAFSGCNRVCPCALLTRLAAEVDSTDSVDDPGEIEEAATLEEGDSVCAGELLPWLTAEVDTTGPVDDPAVV